MLKASFGIKNKNMKPLKKNDVLIKKEVYALVNSELIVLPTALISPVHFLQQQVQGREKTDDVWKIFM